MPVDPVATRRFIESLSTHLEDHLATWKSSLVDARREIETLLTAAGERIPAQARPLFPEDLMEMMLEDVLPPPPAPEKVIERVVEKVLVPAPPQPPDWSSVRASLSAVESARTQVDVLTRFLTQANAHASRVALLVLRNDRLTGWKAIGFDATGGHDDAAKTIDLAADADPFAAEVLKRERPHLASPPDEGSPIRRALGGTAPSRALLVPMVIRDRLAGLLVAEELPGDDGKLNEAALEVLTFVTGLAVDLLAARKRIPSPTLTPPGEAVLQYQPPSVDVGATIRAPAVSFVPEPPPPAVAPPAVTDESPAARWASPAPALAPEPPAPPRLAEHEQTDTGAAKKRVSDAEQAIRALEESASYKKRSDAAASSAAPRPGPPPSHPSLDDLEAAARATAFPRPAPALPPTPAQTGEVTLAFEHLRSGAPPVETPIARPAPPPVVPMVPAAPVAPSLIPARESSAPKSIPSAAAPMQEPLAGGAAQPMAPPVGFIPRSRQRGDDQQRAVDDAKRLARLLVSEIKLYNERKVEEGRASGDLYERLRDDIQRSRQVYEERTPEAIRAGSDFFREELVRILADGRAEALGPMA